MITQKAYLRFIDEALDLAKAIPKYFSKFSNKIYCNHQKLALLVLRQKLKLTYRGLIEWLEVTEEVCLLLGLNRLPDHSTLVKFDKRVSTSLLNGLINMKEAKIVAVDSSGFETESMSYYYRNVYNMNRKQKARRYLKVSLAADTDKQFVLSNRIRLGPRNDHIDFKSLLRNLSTKFVVADKGYDSKANNQFVLRRKAYPIIARKKNTRVYYEKLGKRLKFDEKIYHQRSKSETVFSVIKRKYGSIVKARSFESQKKEVICRLIAYNLDRKIILSFLLIRGFQQSFIIYNIYQKMYFQSPPPLKTTQLIL